MEDEEELLLQRRPEPRPRQRSVLDLEPEEEEFLVRSPTATSPAEIRARAIAQRQFMYGNPEEEARIRRLAASTQTPLAIARAQGVKSLEAAEAQRSLANITPTLTRVFNDEERARVLSAQDVVGLERLGSDLMGRGAVISDLQIQTGRLGREAFQAQITGQPFPAAKAEELRRLKVERARETSLSWQEGVVPFVANAVSETGVQLVAALPSLATGGAIGAAGGAAAGAIVGGVGAIPGAKAGFSVGVTAGQFAFSVEQQIGLSFVEYAEQRDEKGQFLDGDVVAGAALTAGVINAVGETAAGVFLARVNIPGLDRLLGRGAKDVVSELLATPQGRDTLRRLTVNAGQAATIEGATEFLQQLVSIAVGEGASAVNEGAGALEVAGRAAAATVTPEALASAGEAALRGAVGGGGLTIATAPLTVPVENYLQRRELERMQRLARTAEGGIATVERAVEVAKAMPLTDRDRTTLAQFVNAAAEEGPISTIYVAPADLQSLAQDRGVSYEALAQSMGATKQQIAQADAAPGTLIEIAVGDFVAAVAKTDLETDTLQIIKTDPLLFTRREIDALREQGADEAIAVANRLAVDMAADLEGRAEIINLQQDLEAELAPVQQAIEQGLAPLITDGAARQIGDKGVIPYARIAAQSYAVIGQIEGISASEARQRYPLRFAAMQRSDKGLGQPPREIPVLPEPDTPEWTAMIQGVADKQARGERLTANERIIANYDRVEAAELARILQRIREGKELTPSSQRFLRERGYDPATGEPVGEGFGQDETEGPEQPRRALDPLGFASIALEAARALPARAMRGSEAVGRITKARGVKGFTGRVKDEIDFLGLRAEFENRKSVTREEIIAYIELHRLVLGEVERRATSPERDAALRQAWATYDDEVRAAKQAFADFANPPREAYNAIVDPARATYEAAIRAAYNTFSRVAQRNAAIRAAQNTFDAIKNSAREAYELAEATRDVAALRQAEATRDAAIRQAEEKRDAAYRAADETYGKPLRVGLAYDLDTDASVARREFVITLPENVTGGETFGPHTRVKGEVINILAADRVDDQGQRTLFIRQLQSDLAQQGRKTKKERDEPIPPLTETTSQWTGAGVRAMVLRAAREGFDSISFPTGETSTIMQGNSRAAGHYDTNVKAAVEKVALALGGQVREGGVEYSPTAGAPSAVRMRMSMDDAALIDLISRETRAIQRMLDTGASPSEIQRVQERIADAQKALTVQKGDKGALAPAYILDITPEMRSQLAAEGLPLFARGEGQRQRIGEYYPNLAEIRLGPDSNMSTFLHEMGHHFLEVHVNVAMSLLDRQAAGETLTDRQLQHIQDMQTAIAEIARQAGQQPAPPRTEGDVLAQEESFGAEAPRRALDPLGFASVALEAARALPDRAMRGSEAVGRIMKARGVEGYTGRVKDEIDFLGLRKQFEGRARVTKQEVIEYIEANRLVLSAVEESYIPQAPLRLTRSMVVDRAVAFNSLHGDKSGFAIGPEIDVALKHNTYTIDGTQTKVISTGEALDNDGKPFRVTPVKAKRQSGSDVYTVSVGYGFFDGQTVIRTDVPQSAVYEVIIAAFKEANYDRLVRKITAQAREDVAFVETEERNEAALQSLRVGDDYDLDTDPDIARYQTTLVLPPDAPGGKQKGSHTDIEGDLMHILWSDRLDEKGQRTLFVRQLQSDLAQSEREFIEKAKVAQRLLDRYPTAKAFTVENVNGELQYVPAPAGEKDSIARSQFENEANIELSPLTKTTSQWTNAGVRAMVMRAVRDGYSSISFPTGETSASFIQGNDIAAGHYDTNVRGALEKVARVFGGEVREGGVRSSAGDASAYVLDITPEMRSQLGKEGLPLFAGGETPAPGPTPPEGADLIRWFASLSLQDRTAMHEVWARMTERYFMEGKSPTPALDNLFGVFKKWLGEVYRSMTSLNVELSDEVRQVMDRLYVAEGNTQRAEEGLGLKPAFTTKPAFMTEQEWRAYQELGQQATQEATADLGARALKDMQWLSGAKSRELRKLQAQHRKLRNAIKAEVTEEIANLPVNRARRFISRGVGPDGQPIPGPHKLSIAALRAQFGDSLDWQSLGYGKYGMLAEVGLDADTLAGMLGYDSGQALLNDLLTQPKQQDAINAETDRRMLEQYGEAHTPEQMERQATEAVHNSLRGRFLAAQHAALAKAIGSRALLRENARAAAEIIVGRQRASKLSVKQAVAAERKAGRRVLMAMRKNDLAAAAEASRDQLLAFEITAETLRQQKAYQSARALFRRVRAGKKENVAKNRNFDLVMAARAILSAFGEGTERQAEEIEGYIKAVQDYDPALYANIEPAMTAAIRNPKPLDQLSVTELTGLRDTIQSLYDLAREEQIIVIEGRTMDREEAVESIVTRLQAVTKTKPQRGLDRAPTKIERDMRAIAGLGSWLRRVESWARQADGGRTGPFTRLIWRPISQAADQYRIARNDFIARYRALFDQIAPTMKPGRIDAPEIGFSFENKSQLLHAILHTGNASNKRKLLLGYGWGTLMPDKKTVDDSRWRAMIERMAADGTLTQADFDFAQSVWDLLEETKSLAQETHRRVFGRYFNEITAETVVTPFGTYRGGYVPAIYDPQTSADIARKLEAEKLEDSSMFPAPANGFTENRTDYVGKMHLDLLLLSGHLDKVLKFSYMAAPVRDVLSVLKDKKVSESLHAYDPTAFDDMLDPWLNRAARQIVETPTTGTGGKAIDAFFRGLRRRSGMGLMFMNFVNVVQQVTGFALAAVRVPPHRLAQGLARYMLNPKGVTDGIRAASAMMRERGDNQASGIFGEIEQIIDPNNKYKQLTMWFARHTYFMQIAFQNVIDVVVWQGAYDDATAKGETHDEAVAQADSVVRQTQSSTLPEDISRAEAGNVGLRLFTHMYNYFNMNANLLATEFQIAIRDMGLRKGAGRLLYVYFLGFAIPAVIGQALADAMRGQLPEDEEDDGYLDDWLTYTLETQRKYLLGFVPIAGQGINAAFNHFNEKPFDDRVGTSPAVSIYESASRTPESVYKAIMEEGDQSRAAKDLLNAMTLATGIPFSAASRPVGYALDVAEGDVEPADELDYARGLVTGSASEASKNNQ